jgi:hypothetical protein
MPLYKFGEGDVFYNRIKAHPSSSFFIYNSKIYLNNAATQPGANVANTPNVPVGHINLLELNVDRAANSDASLVIGVSSSATNLTAQNVPDTGLIYPFVTKGSHDMAFKGITRDNYINNYTFGDVITGSYQLSSSITRQLYQNTTTTNPTGSALKNSLDYAALLGEHYILPSGSNSLDVNIIQIPSIFYGSEIKKGTVDLKFYMTGTLIGRLRDKRYNGALIQESGHYSSGQDGQTAGVVLYKEGFIFLTGSWNLDASPTLNDVDVDGNAENGVPKWIRFGMGANDKISTVDNIINSSASFTIDFAGTHRIPTVTMLAHANRGELNYSNNPTYIEHTVNTASYFPITASYLYSERELTIKNIHSSSFSDPTGSLKKTTYITKVGIYDDKKKLIGIASVAKPVKKTEERDLTFKLKLDI